MELKKTLAFFVVALLVLSGLSVSFAFGTEEATKGKNVLEKPSVEEETSEEDPSIENPVESYISRGPIRIDGDTDLNETAQEEGWDGNGSEDNPYIIDGYEIDAEGRWGAGIFIGNTTDHFIIENCVVKRSTSISTPYHPGGGIVYHEVENGTLRDTEIYTSDYGLYLHGIDDNHFEGIKISSIGNDGIFLKSSSNNTFVDSKVYTTNNHGFYFEGECDSNNLIELLIRNNAGDGVHIAGDLDSNEFTDLTIEANTNHGIYIPDGQSFEGNKIEGCRISSNGVDGIRLGSNSDPEKISGNEIGNNYVYDNGRAGIRLESDSFGHQVSNYIYGNTIEDNEEYEIFFATRDSLSNHFDNNKLNGVQYVHHFDQDNESITVNETYDFDSYQRLTNYGGVVFYESENITLEKINVRTLDSRGITVFSSEHIELTDLEVTNCTEEGILIEDSKHISLSNFAIMECTEAISIGSSNNISLADAEVADSTDGISAVDSEDIDLTNIIVDGSGETGVSIESSEVVAITDLEVRNSGTDGVSIEGSTNIEMTGVEVTRSSGHGISMVNTEGIELIDLTVTGCSETGVYMEDVEDIDLEEVVAINNQNGVELADSNSGTLKGLSAEENEIGLQLDNSRNIIVSDGTFTSNQVGIRFSDSDMNEIRRSDILANQEDGILFSGASSVNTISANHISNNHQDGIHLTGEASTCTLEENVISDNMRYGIYTSTDSNSISDNNITRNLDYGVYLEGSSSSVFNNRFMFNNGSNFTYDPSSVQAFDGGSANSWYDLDEYGNYWWDWMEKYDPDKDDYDDAKVIDEPYPVDGESGSEDLYPLYADIEDHEIYELTIEIEKEGSTHPEEGTTTYLEGETATIEAIPVHGYVFSNWTGDISGEPEDRVITVLMDEDKTLSANFKRDEFDLTIDIDGEGTTEPSEGTHTYLYEDEVTVTAESHYGWHFSNWAGDNQSEEEEITIVVDEDKRITAVFERKEFDLTIDIEGEGTTDPSEGIHTYLYEDEVILTADPAQGWVFSNWTGANESEEEEITLVMDEDKNITAIFERDEFELTIGIEGEGTTDPPEGTHTYLYEENVTVTAEAGYGWYFGNWTGDVPEGEEENEVITLTMDTDREIIVHFEEIEEWHTLEIETEGNGTVEIDGEEVDELPYEEEIPDGEEVELEGVSEPGWSFSEWTGDLSTYSMGFDGDGDVVNCGDNDSLKFDDEAMTISAQVRPKDTEEHMGIAGKLHYNFEAGLPPIFPNSHNYYGYSLSMNESRFQFQVGNGTGGGTEKIVSQDTFEAEEWYQVTGVHDGDNFYLYVNGQLQGFLQNHTIADFDDDFVIGRQYTPDSDVGELGGPRWWNGTINDVRVYDRDLSETEIGEMYENRDEALGGEVGWWSMDEGAGDTVYDRSHNENDGDITGAEWVDFPVEAVPEKEITITMDENKSMKANFVESAELMLDSEGKGEIYVDGGSVELPYTEEYEEGAEVTLTAGPAEDWRFDQWVGDVPDRDKEKEEITLTMDDDKNVTARFERIDYYLLTMNIDGEGTTDPSEGTHSYEEGSEVTITATADEGWTFEEWTGTDETGERITITMDENKDITAYFTRKEYDLTIDIEGDGRTTPSEGTHIYEYGEEVTVTAVPQEGWKFEEWRGDHEGVEEEITITMDEDKDITAYFSEIVEYSLTINVEGEGSTDPAEGSHAYEEDEEVTITAMPAENWYFKEWTGDHQGTNNETTITMDSDKEITAHFEEYEPNFEVEITHSPQEALEGDEIEVVYKVDNTGDPGKQTVDFKVDGEVEGSEEVTLDPGETHDGVFTWQTEEGDAGEHEVTVASEDDQYTETLTLLRRTFFETEITSVEEDDEFVEGENVTVEYTVENLGVVSGTQDIQLYVDDDLEIEEEVRIEGGKSYSGTFTWIPEEPYGERNLTVESQDHSDMVTISVLEEAHFEVDMVIEEKEVTAGEEVVIEYTVSNTGGVEDSRTIELIVDGEVEDSYEITLGEGEKYEGQFVWEAEEAGEHELNVEDEVQTINVLEEPNDELLLIAIIGLLVLLIAVIGFGMSGEEETADHKVLEKKEEEVEEEGTDEEETEEEKVEEGSENEEESED